MIVCSIAIQMLSVATLWRAIDWRSLGVFLIGGFLGVPAGVYLLLHLPTATYRIVIGGLLIVYGSYLLLRRPARALRLGPVSDACAGFLGGITGGLAGFPGAFVTIWCGLKGWDKARQRGVYQPFILSMQPVTLIAIHLMRPSSSVQGQLDWKALRFRSGRLARRVVRPAHFQAALGPAVRVRRQRVADRVRHRPHPLNHRNFSKHRPPLFSAPSPRANAKQENAMKQSSVPPRLRGVQPWPPWQRRPFVRNRRAPTSR